MYISKYVSVVVCMERWCEPGVTWLLLWNLAIVFLQSVYLFTLCMNAIWFGLQRLCGCV